MLVSKKFGDFTVPLNDAQTFHSAATLPIDLANAAIRDIWVLRAGRSEGRSCATFIVVTPGIHRLYAFRSRGFRDVLVRRHVFRKCQRY